MPDDDCDDGYNDDPCPDCGRAYCDCDDDRSDHERGACWGPGCCEECDTPPIWWVREQRARKPQRGSRNARRKRQDTRDRQAQRRAQRKDARRARDLGCCACPGGWTPDCDCIPF